MTNTPLLPKLEEIKLASEHLDADGIVRCPITRQSMAIGSTAVRLSCNHLFEPDAIRQWLGRSNSCPVCRAPQALATTPILDQPTPVPTQQREHYLAVMIGTHDRMADYHRVLSRQYANELRDLTIAHMEHEAYTGGRLELRLLAAHNMSQMRLLRNLDSTPGPGNLTLDIISVLEEARHSS